MDVIAWHPWRIQTEGPPCARGCAHWKPMFQYTASGAPDGIRLCHAMEQHRDFSCFQPKAFQPQHNQENAVIQPTVGRVVLFNPSKWQRNDGIGAGPLAAIVCRVWNDRMVNLVVFSEAGVPKPVSSVQLVQDGDQAPDPDNMYCEWMPYQKQVAAGHIQPTLHAGQAAKT